MSRIPAKQSLRNPFSVDVSTAGVQVSGVSPETITFTSVQSTAAPPTGVQPGQALNTAPPPTPAGFWEMAQSFTSSVTQFAASGFRTVSDEVQQSRLAVCATCEHHTGTRCNLCGCFTAAKSWMPHETCPIGKWPQ